MIERKPEYYDAFCCTADKCMLTCCQQWKIAVDDDTYEKWKTVPPPTTLMNGGTETETTEQKAQDRLSAYTTCKDDTRVIKLDTGKKCPFLSEKKLCNLVIAYGDDILSKTCAIFPRQVNTFQEREVQEYSLVACCPAVIDIWKEQTVFHVEEQGDCAAELHGYDVYEQALSDMRDRLIEMVQMEQYTLPETLMAGFYILLSLSEKEAEEAEKKSSAEQIGNALKKLIAQYTSEPELGQIIKTIREKDFSALYTFEERNELFLDLAENYRKEGIYTEWLNPIAALAEQWSADYEECEIQEALAAFAQQFAVYDGLMRRYVASECFANLLLPEYDLENVMVAFQWIAMEYATMKQAFFLQWMLDGKKEPVYETMRDMLVIIARMMGYDEPDIRAYMENSFEEVVWEWGYLALLCGM